MNYADPSRPAAERQHLYFALFFIATLPFFWGVLRTLFTFSLMRESCSHIFLIPAITAILIYLQRKTIFHDHSVGRSGGILILLVGFGIFGFSRELAPHWGEYEAVSLGTVGILLTWLGAFIFSYGYHSFRAALFPLLFLFWMIPVPISLLDRVIFLLQEGTSAIAEVLFHWSGVPVFRQGFIFSLPGLTIEVAKECSGIRSSLALVITAMLASYLFLRTIWKRAVLVAFALPLAIIKNGARIVVLSLLSIRVNPNFMRGPLHQEGGILFFVLALVLFAPVLLWLERSEGGATGPTTLKPVAEKSSSS
jgi:exosortase